MKRRLLPAPLISLLLAPAWLALAGSVSLGNLLIAVALAWALPFWAQRHVPAVPWPRCWPALLRLAAVVLCDIVVCNIEVARRVLGPEAAIRPRFVWVPIGLKDPYAITMLGGIITLTPGTLTAAISDDRRHLLVHALHCPDAAAEAALVQSIKSRYEAPLAQIFG